MDEVAETDLALAAVRVVEQTGRVVVEAERVPRGVMTHKYRVRTRDDQIIVRFYPPGREHVLAFEPDLWKRARAQLLRVPEVLFDGRTGPAAPLEYVAYSWLPGEPLDLVEASLDDVGLRGVVDEVVTQCSMLAALPVEGFGPLVSSSSALHESFHEFAAASSAAVAWDQHPELAALGRRAFEAVIEEIEQTHEPPSIVWGDVSPENVIVGPDGLVSLLDFEGAIAGHTQGLLGYANARLSGTRFLSAFSAAWSERWPRADRLITAAYSVLRGLRIAEHAARPMPTGVPRLGLAEALPGLPAAVRELRQHGAGPTELGRRA